MSTLFSERFQGHEAPVDPGVWEGIQQQLAASAAAGGEDGLTDLFKERFQGHETAVDPSVWQAVSRQLGHAATAGTTSAGILGWAAAGTAVVVAGIAGYLFLSDPPAPGSIASTPAVIEQVEQDNDRGSDVRMERTIDATSPSTDRTEARTVPQPVPPASYRPTRTERRDPAPLPMAPIPATPAKDLRPALDPVDQRAQEGSARVESIIQELTNEVEKNVKARPAAVSSEVTLIEPIQQNPDLSIAAEELGPLPELYIPNTFTPNGDGINDTYMVNMAEFSSLLLRVYSISSDRLVFSTNSGEPWNGEGCADGMYMVAVEAVTKDGRTVSEGKVVWLTRERAN
ncbi:MAG: gliding motility-associated C-terminal domain-containing protein [Flavobacteriales bacterium]